MSDTRSPWVEIPQNSDNPTTQCSSTIAAVAYKPEEQKLGVEFRNGAVYAYEGVPPQVVTYFTFADSAGSAFDALVKNGGYPYKKLEGGRGEF